LADGAACTSAAQCVSNACTAFYVDADGDQYGAGAATMFCGTTAPTGYAAKGGDCCDSNPAINPGAGFQTTIGTCNGNTTWDYNCDGTVETQKTGTVAVPNGCAPGAVCGNCTAAPNVIVPIVQTCGAYTPGTACAAECPSPPAPGCTGVPVQTVQQACR
jgi:hypothetical protein